MHQALFFLPPAAAAVFYGLRLRELGTDRQVIAGRILERGTLRLFIAVGTCVFAGLLIEFLLRRPAFQWLPFALGCLGGAAAIILRRSAIQALGRFWSLHVEIREAHEFVQTGPFRLVRHPAYFSMLLELLAVPLICQSYWTMAAVPLLFMPVLARRIQLEEAALREKFGDAYRAYQQSIPALIPGLW